MAEVPASDLNFIKYGSEDVPPDHADDLRSPTKKEVKQARFIASFNADTQANKMPIEHARRSRETRQKKDLSSMFKKW